MSSETEYIRDRLNLFELMRHVPDWSLRAYARELNRDPRWVRTWAARLRPFVEGPYPPLTVFASHSRRPHRSPQGLSPDIAKLICRLRPQLSEQFHRRAGAKTIQATLHQCLPDTLRVPCLRTIYDALHKGGVMVPRPKRVHTPLVLPPPMEEWEGRPFGRISIAQ